MPLDPDNKSHRAIDKVLDEKFSGGPIYDCVTRPIIHSTYHAGRFVFNGGNPEEWARAKDQLSKLGTGQTQTEYLETHRQEMKQKELEKQKEK